jgi:uncharacterized protein (TIGR03083 family)
LDKVDTTDTWAMIETERTSLVEALAQLPDASWDQPTLCEKWTVREVVAHLIASTYLSVPKFFLAMASNGFNFDKMVDQRQHAIGDGKTPTQLVNEYRSRITSHTAPPAPKMTWLGETVIHGEDIFRAGGTYGTHPIERVVAVANFYKGSNAIVGAKKRIAGVTLRATDTEWSTGTGPEVSGPMIVLLLAMVGRQRVLNDLTGEGLAVLRSAT